MSASIVLNIFFASIKIIIRDRDVLPNRPRSRTNNTVFKTKKKKKWRAGIDKK